MASSVTIEVDHKRGSVWVRGSPEAVEEGRKDFQNKLASLFPGDFLAVRNACRRKYWSVYPADLNNNLLPPCFLRYQGKTSDNGAFKIASITSYLDDGENP